MDEYRWSWQRPGAMPFYSIYGAPHLAYQAPNRNREAGEGGYRPYLDYKVAAFVRLLTMGEGDSTPAPDPTKEEK